MSYNYINGYSVGKLEVKLNNTILDTFIFPIEDESGKKEEVQDDIVIHKLITGELKQFFKGTHLIFTIPFEEAAGVNVSEIMKKLRDYRRKNAGHIFILTPNYLDVPKRYFDVLLYNEKINLGIERAEETAQFNTGIVFSFITRYYVDENWINKNDYSESQHYETDGTEQIG